MTNPPLQPDKLIGYAFPEITFTYSKRDVVLYALGVGAPANPLDHEELRFVYELSSGFCVLPTFAATFPNRMIEILISGTLPDGTRYNPMMLVHGEQYLELSGELPVQATITCKPVISAVYDKGSGAIIVTDIPCLDEHGEQIAFNRSTMFIRGLGNFGGERGPSGEINTPPDRPPDATAQQKTLETQALIYRLSGDINPLHADPMMAAFGGFDKPILHGLSTFGFAARAVLKHFAGNDPARFKSFKVRFAGHVFPGETLFTSMWQESPTRIIFQTHAAERDTPALTNAAIELRSQNDS
jgi:3-hydroxyacyl-CoA dehydrogenase/3a,7a,12a-trihydroxy-5b-cholest-24-enoyl-CoA hydratase